MRKETVFALAELRRVCLTCPHCGTEVVLDLARYTPPGPGVTARRSLEKPAFAPAQCPACKGPYDSALEALETLQQAFAALAKVEAGVVTFRAAAGYEA